MSGRVSACCPDVPWHRISHTDSPHALALANKRTAVARPTCELPPPAALGFCVLRGDSHERCFTWCVCR